MGGYVAFGLWRRHADRIGGLVLACTRARADTPVEQEGRHRTAAAVRAHGADDVVEALPPRMLAPDAPAERLEHVRAIVGRQPPEGMAAFLEAMAARRDATADLPGLAIPALVVAGAADALIDRSEVVALAEGLPDARLVVIPGAGHLAPLEEPGAFNAALRSFLERVDADLEA
jgi:pimeloyl-ACP methyl ester carboxylesterase